MTKPYTDREQKWISMKQKVWAFLKIPSQTVPVPKTALSHVPCQNSGTCQMTCTPGHDNICHMFTLLLLCSPSLSEIRHNTNNYNQPAFQLLHRWRTASQSAMQHMEAPAHKRQVFLQIIALHRYATQQSFWGNYDSLTPKASLHWAVLQASFFLIL